MFFLLCSFGGILMKLKKSISVLVAAAMLLTVVSLSFSAFADSAASQQVADVIEGCLRII